MDGRITGCGTIHFERCHKKETPSVTQTQLQDLVLVAGHAPFKAAVTDVPTDPQSDESWVLQPFQSGEPPFYLEHIRRGVALTRDNPRSLLIFSGGRTRPEAGAWSKARTYLEIARAHRFWLLDTGDPKNPTFDEVTRRTTTEVFARDSFENLFFAICRFQQVVGSYPRRVTVVGWAFKTERFGLHRNTLSYPSPRFQYVGVNDPVDLDSVQEGERTAIRHFRRFPYGVGGALAEKRAGRNPFSQEHDYRQCPGLQSFFAFMDNAANTEKRYTGSLPWKEGAG